jgi:hypothetical protein
MTCDQPAASRPLGPTRGPLKETAGARLRPRARLRVVGPFALLAAAALIFAGLLGKRRVEASLVALCGATLVLAVAERRAPPD